jgi:BlaI family transcriptional regulator, penicillinase repressor
MSMPQPRLSKLELQIMEAFWRDGALSIRDVQERFSEKKRPAYTTVQTMVNRLEAKGALRRTSKTGNAHIFEAAISQGAAQRRLTDEFIALFGGRMQPLMSHLVESGKLTLEDVQDAERKLHELSKKKDLRK